MCKLKVTGLGVIALGVLILVMGAVRIYQASVIHEGASEIRHRQVEVWDAFHRDARVLSERYQAGEIDEEGWRRETHALQARTETDSDAAGSASIGKTMLGIRTQKQGSILLLSGLLFAVVGAMLIAAVHLVQGRVRCRPAAGDPSA